MSFVNQEGERVITAQSLRHHLKQSLEQKKPHGHYRVLLPRGIKTSFEYWCDISASGVGVGVGVEQKQKQKLFQTEKIPAMSILRVYQIYTQGQELKDERHFQLQSQVSKQATIEKGWSPTSLEWED